MQVEAYQFSNIRNDTVSRAGRATLQAQRLFNRALSAGRFKRLWAGLTGQARSLAYLGDVERAHNSIAHEHAGIMPVRLEHITGSRCKADTFDAEFHPLDRTTVGRWVSVCSGMLLDVNCLPPVELVQVGNAYYVIDGHHRVSAARALGYLYINATVTRWHVA